VSALALTLALTLALFQARALFSVPPPPPKRPLSDDNVIFWN
jgi:hypothetical protein